MQKEHVFLFFIQNKPLSVSLKSTNSMHFNTAKMSRSLSSLSLEHTQSLFDDRVKSVVRLEHINFDSCQARVGDNERGQRPRVVVYYVRFWLHY